jgi:hypothetical protein
MLWKLKFFDCSRDTQKVSEFGSGGVAQVLQHFPSKREALGSNSSNIKEKVSGSTFVD